MGFAVSGKTIMVLYDALRTGGTIIVKTQKRADFLKYIATELGMKVPNIEVSKPKYEGVSAPLLCVYDIWEG